MQSILIETTFTSHHHVRFINKDSGKSWRKAIKIPYGVSYNDFVDATLKLNGFKVIGKNNRSGRDLYLCEWDWDVLVKFYDKALDELK